MVDGQRENSGSDQAAKVSNPRLILTAENYLAFDTLSFCQFPAQGLRAQFTQLRLYHYFLPSSRKTNAVVRS